MEIKERRNRWRKVCTCTIKVAHHWDAATGLDVCDTCGNVIVVIERRKEMQNEVSFKTGERPRFSGKAKFPYNRLIQSLITLYDTTKCVILDDGKEFKQNHLTFLRKLMGKEGYYVKACKQDGKWNLWVVKSEVIDE